MFFGLIFSIFTYMSVFDLNLINLVDIPMFLVVFLACSEAQYTYPTPKIPFTTPSSEYLPPVTTPSEEYLPPVTTTTTEKPYEPDSNIPDIIIVKTTTTSKPTTTTEHHHHHDVPFWDFRESIPGEPEQDYPILDKIPSTKFACDDRLDGNCFQSIEYILMLT